MSDEREIKRLTKSSDNRIISGVCGGFGEFFHVDPTIIRIIWSLMSLFGVGVILYLICIFVMPEE